MKSSSVRVAFACAAALSLAGKLLSNRGVPEPDLGQFQETALAVLRAQGYQAWARTSERGLVVRGRKRGCTIMLADYSPYGTFADVFQEMAAPIGPLKFIYDGALYTYPPKVFPLGRFYIERELHRVGIATSRSPIVAVAASPACDISRLDWQALSRLPVARPDGPRPAG